MRISEISDHNKIILSLNPVQFDFEDNADRLEESVKNIRYFSTQGKMAFKADIDNFVMRLQKFYNHPQLDFSDPHMNAFRDRAIEIEEYCNKILQRIV